MQINLFFDDFLSNVKMTKQAAMTPSPLSEGILAREKIGLREPSHWIIISHTCALWVRHVES